MLVASMYYSSALEIIYNKQKHRFEVRKLGWATDGGKTSEEMISFVSSVLYVWLGRTFALDLRMMYWRSSWCVLRFTNLSYNRTGWHGANALPSHSRGTPFEPRLGLILTKTFRNFLQAFEDSQSLDWDTTTSIQRLSSTSFIYHRSKPL
jgi:hypothetical protein